MTVAHVFYDYSRDVYTRRYPKAAVFVPAMKDKDDYFGMMYGHYPIIEVKEHPQFEFNVFHRHDIATASIGRGWFTNSHLQRELALVGFPNVDRTLFNDTDITSFGLKKIDLRLDELLNDNIAWMAVGYGRREDGGNASDGSDGGRMTKVVGTIVNGDQVKVVMNAELRRGMSGGPWLLHTEPKCANGCQSGTNFEGHTSVSPYFSSRLFYHSGFLVQ